MVSVDARRRHQRLPPTKGGTSARPAGPARKLGYLNSAPGGSGHDRLCAGFRTPECQDHPRALAAGVRKAPRHEIAGCGAPTVQRALWGFGAGVSVGEVEPTLAIGSL